VLTTAQLDVLTTAQIRAISDVDLTVLDSAQIAALDSSQIQALSISQIRVLTTTQYSEITSDTLSYFSTEQISAIQNEDIEKITVGAIEGLSTEQLVALSPTQIQFLSASQLHALGTDDLGALTGSQMAAITNTQLSALRAISTDDVAALQASPIVLDLDGDGIHTSRVGDGVVFDLNAEGRSVQTGWTSGGDGLLALDRNGNGRIDDGSELFGQAFALPDGSRAPDGFAALRSVDDNADGVIDARDAVFSQLRVWVDANHDGVSQADELLTLRDAGVKSIETSAEAGSNYDNGNWLGLEAHFETTTGETRAAVDVWFRIIPVEEPAKPEVVGTPPPEPH
jgi:hypothetical protein